MSGIGVAALAALSLSLLAHPAAGQHPTIDLDTQVTFYGDNTELANPFRESETQLGTQANVLVEAKVAERLAIRIGAFGHQRFGASSGFDQLRPVLALVIGTPRSRLVLGTLETMRRRHGPGPDREGPHGLLPPLQRETLAFERGWEGGLQWTIDSPRVSHDSWLHWQRLNTSDEREVFDAGLTSRFRLHRALTFRTDAHIVHQGGQLSSVGPVADSWSSLAGIEAGGAVPPLDRVSLEALAAVSRFVPDRERLDRSATGFGAFFRASAEKAGWRLHAIMWRAGDFIKVEGDPHYQAIRIDGTRHRGLRDYAEAGIARSYAFGGRSFLESSVRWHRVENRHGYSYRLVAVARLRSRLAE
jgi:hypothetical protein